MKRSMIQLFCLAMVMCLCLIPWTAEAAVNGYFSFSKTTVEVGEPVAWKIVFTGSSNWGVTMGEIYCAEADYDEYFDSSSGTETFDTPGKYSFDAHIEYEEADEEGWGGFSVPTKYVTVVEKLVIKTQPQSVKVAEGKTATFKVVASGATSYQWYYRKTSSSAWTAVSNNGTSATYTLTTEARHNGYQYRCLVKNSARSVFTNIVTLTVNCKPVITTQPANAKVNEGKTATFKVVASGATSYQWYYRKTSSSEWTAVSNNGTSATYTLTTAARHNGYQYRCLVKNSVGSVFSNIVTLTVNCKPVITSQPSNVTVTVGKTATFKVAATGATSYQWYYMKPGESTWNEVSTNGTSATYNLTTATRHNGYKYRCKLTNSAGSVYTSIVTLTVN